MKTLSVDIEINSGNDSVQYRPMDEVRRILSDIVRYIDDEDGVAESISSSQILRDINGNAIGRCHIAVDFDDEEMN